MIHISKEEKRLTLAGDTLTLLNELGNGIESLLTSVGSIGGSEAVNNIAVNLVKLMAIIFHKIEEEHGYEIDLEIEDDEEEEEPFDPMEALEALIKTAKELADKKKKKED